MANRREVLTAAAHKVLLDNPEMYRNIANVQALRKEQARRWTQRIVGLNDPGPGSVEQAFMSSGDMNEIIPKLLDQKAKLLKPLAEKATEALKQKVGMDDSLAKILIANIGAEGQSKAAWLNASGGLNQEALKISFEALEKQGQYTRDALGLAAPTDDMSVANIDKAYAAALGRSAGGGESSQTEAEALVKAATPAELAGLLNRAYQSKDEGVIERIGEMIEKSGKQQDLIVYTATKTAEDTKMRDRFSALSLDVAVAGEKGVSQVDRMQQTLSRGMIATDPRRGAVIRNTLAAMGDPVLKKQLDDAVGQKVSDEEKKALKDVDDALAKANASVDLAMPTEVREQSRTCSGYVEAAEKALEQAGTEDDGKLMGLGAAARRAARQQSRGVTKDLEGEGEDAQVSTRRLALSKAQTLARKNKAPGWANSEDDKVKEGVEAARAAEKVEAKKKADPVGGSFELDDEDNSDIDVGTPDIDGWKIPPSKKPAAREQASDAAQTSLEAARASRRSGAASALRGLLEGSRPKPAPSEPVEADDEDEAVAADAPLPRRPVDYYRRPRTA